jgi:hypothetical protein
VSRLSPRFVRFRRPLLSLAVGLATVVLVCSSRAGIGRADTLSQVAGEALTALSCSNAAARDCDALAYPPSADREDYSLVQITRGIPGSQIPLPASFDAMALSCSGINTCLITGSDNSVGAVLSVTNGNVGSLKTLAGTVGIQGLSCPAAARCLAVGSTPGAPPGLGDAGPIETAVVLPITNGVPGTVRTVAGTMDFDAISCSDATDCTAVGANQAIPSGCEQDCLPEINAVVAEIVNGIPGTVRAAGGDETGLSGVACPLNSTDCVAVGSVVSGGFSTAIVVPTDDGVARSETLIAGSFELEGVACPTSSGCIAVGGGAKSLQSGVLIPLSTAGKPGKTRTEPNAHLLGIDCASLTVCTAVGTYSVTDGAVLSIGAAAQSSTSASTSASITAALSGSLKVGGSDSGIAAILRTGGFVSKFAAPASGSATLSWYYLPRGARLTAEASKSVLVAVGSKRFTKSGSATISLRLTSAGRALLKRATRVQLTALGSFTPKGAKAITARRAITLTRH